jgi:hypothetical protein
VLLTGKATCSSTLLGEVPRAHNLKVGFLVNFKWKGDGEFRVKVFDNTS